jgi:hypothetical protein
MEENHAIKFYDHQLSYNTYVFILFIEADVFVQHSYKCVHLVLEQRKKSVKKE